MGLLGIAAPPAREAVPPPDCKRDLVLLARCREICLGRVRPCFRICVTHKCVPARVMEAEGALVYAAVPRPLARPPAVAGLAGADASPLGRQPLPPVPVIFDPC